MVNLFHIIFRLQNEVSEFQFSKTNEFLKPVCKTTQNLKKIFVAALYEHGNAKTITNNYPCRTTFLQSIVRCQSWRNFALRLASCYEKSREKNGEQPPYFDTRATKEFDYFLAPLNSIAIPSLLFGESAEIIAQGTQNFLFIKDLIQSTKISFFNLSLSKKEEREKSFLMFNVLFLVFVSPDKIKWMKI